MSALPSVYTLRARIVPPVLLLIVSTGALASRGLAAQVGGGAPGVYELIARHSDKCLTVRDASLVDGAPVEQRACGDGEHQQWTLERVDDLHVRIVSRLSGKVLDVSGASLEDEAAAIQSSVDGGEHQHWTLDPLPGGSVVLIARHSGLALDVSAESLDEGGAVIQYRRHDGLNQQWLLREVSGTAPVPPPPPNQPLFRADVVRFLEQATWGPTPALVAHVQEIGLEAFLDEQFHAPASSYPTLPLYPTTRDVATCPNGSTCQRDNYTMYPLQTRFFRNALYGEDQLRQRVAFALHQILVVSGVEITHPARMTPYLQLLDRHAFGNYRELLGELTLNPAMGNYLDANGNSRTRPNENYAREILQLFSIGTVRLNTDGTPQLDAGGATIPAYTQETVNNFARVFTGWRLAPAPAPGVPNYLDPMVANQAQHDTGSKTLLNGAVLPAGRSAAADLDDALDNIFHDANVGPFVAKQLIQHLVTSNPSPEYVARVASVFDGSQGTRGDLRAVVRAILLDSEARGARKDDPSYGRLRHPAQFIAGVLRAFNARSADGTGESDGYLNPYSSAAGMDVFRPPSVFSYFSPFAAVPGAGGLRGPEFGAYSTSTALARINFVNTVAFGRVAVSANAPRGTALDLSELVPLAGDPPALVAALEDLLLHGAMSAAMREAVVEAVFAVPAANALRRARTAVYLVASSSQYQVQR